ncbi:hypothetical protein TruAng_011860 [Truncatella angustata]|nr:hypothetical protein TruAng_011860 [Truncatella angustata]
MDRFKTLDHISILFSFWAESGSQRKLIDLLRTALWHLLQNVSDAAAMSTALKAIKPDVYCIIDGVDESIDDWTRPGDGCLKVILGLVQDHPNFHVLFLGRESSLIATLKAAPRSLEITQEMVVGDMDKLIASELRQCSNIQSVALRQEVYETIKAKSNIMFLWVILVFRQLNQCFSDSEVKHELKNTPRDLDREFTRIFRRLLERTSGTSFRPSMSMKRAKRLLSIMMAAAEPMTAPELCHAYAVQVNPTQSYTDDLLTKEGIVNACGDFVRVTSDRYHIAHSTVTNFLTRPLSEWLPEDQDILFFQVDLLDAQKAMLFSCLDYFNLLNLGYPLVEESSTTLPTRYPLFSYALNFIPFHVLQLRSYGPSSCLTTKLEEFFHTTQFCAMVEFMIRTVTEESWTVVYRYIELVLSDLGGLENDSASLIELNVDPSVIFANESLRRQKSFGPEDPRTQSWNLLATALAMSSIKVGDELNIKVRHVSDSTDDHQTAQSHSMQTTTTPDGNGKVLLPGQIPTVVSNNVLLAVMQRFDTKEHLVASSKKAQLAVSTSLFKPLLTIINKLVLSPMWIVPPSCLLLCAWVIERGCRETPEQIAQARNLVSLARKKLKNKQNFWESMAICYEVWLTDGRWDEAVECLIMQSLAISKSLPPLPHIEALTMQSLIHLVVCLIDMERPEEAREMARQLESQVNGQDRLGKEQSRLARAVYKSKTWGIQKLWAINAAAADIYDTNIAEAETMFRSAINNFDKFNTTQLSTRGNRQYRVALTWHYRCLCNMKQFAEAEVACRQYIQFSQTLPKHEREWRRLEGISNLRFSLLCQDKTDEARQWMASVQLPTTNGPEDSRTNQSHSTEWLLYMEELGFDWFLLGEFDKATQTFQDIIAYNGKQGPTRSTEIRTAHRPSQRLNTLELSEEAQTSAFHSLDVWRASENTERDEIKWLHDKTGSLWSRRQSQLPQVWEMVYFRLIDLSQEKYGLTRMLDLYDDLACLYADSGELQASVNVCAEVLQSPAV